MTAIDETDQRILTMLEADGRATLGIPEDAGGGMGLVELSTGRQRFARGDRR